MIFPKNCWENLEKSLVVSWGNSWEMFYSDLVPGCEESWGYPVEVCVRHRTVWPVRGWIVCKPRAVEGGVCLVVVLSDVWMFSFCFINLSKATRFDIGCLRMLLLCGLWRQETLFIFMHRSAVQDRVTLWNVRKEKTDLTWNSNTHTHTLSHTDSHTYTNLRW